MQPSEANGTLVKHRITVPTLATVLMREGDIIPFHVHGRRDKRYVFSGIGRFSVFLYRPRGGKRQALIREVIQTGPEDRLATVEVPRGTFHAVVCHYVNRANADFSETDGRATFDVVATGNDPTDIHWDPNLEQLLAHVSFNPKIDSLPWA
jgi:hypothetical protein